MIAMIIIFNQALFSIVCILQNGDYTHNLDLNSMIVSRLIFHFYVFISIFGIYLYYFYSMCLIVRK